MTKLGVVMSDLQDVRTFVTLDDTTARFWQQSSTGGLSRCLPARPVKRRSPFLQHCLTAARIANVAGGEAGHAIGAEMPEILAHLAPRHHHAHLVEEAERERPDHALRRGAAGIAVEEAELALVADRLPHHAEVDR